MSLVFTSQNEAVSPELQEFIDSLGPANFGPQAQIVGRLAVTHVQEHEASWEAWKKFASSEGFGEKSWKTALKFFWAAQTTMTTAQAALALRNTKSKIEMITMALGR